MPKLDCLLCGPQEHTLLEAENFRVMCDPHPLTEGHVLISPKEHLPCVGSFPHALLKEFRQLYRECLVCMEKIYQKPVATFEHGACAQTVFHSHMHFLPFAGNLEQVIAQDEKRTDLGGMEDLKSIFERDGHYLFLSQGKTRQLIETRNPIKAFFRVRFAHALGAPEREHWHVMKNDASVMQKAHCEIENLGEKWREEDKRRRQV